MDGRLRLAVLANEGTYTVSELAKQFGFSRKTAYTWIGRHREGGAATMNNRGRDSVIQPMRIWGNNSRNQGLRHVGQTKNKNCDSFSAGIAEEC